MQEVRAALDEIRAKNGLLTAEVVVNASRPKDAPLHDRFTWDNKAAGEKWRHEEARKLIQSVKATYREPEPVEVDDEPGEPPRLVRAFVHIRDEDGDSYHPVEEVAADPVRRQVALSDMQREWRSMYARYKHFAEFVEMVRRDVDGAGDVAA